MSVEKLYKKMRVECHLDREREEEGEDTGRILEEGWGTVGAEETCGGMNARKERSIGKETRRAEALVRGNRVRPTESLTCINKASCVYEPKLIRLCCPGNSLARALAA